MYNGCVQTAGRTRHEIHDMVTNIVIATLIATVIATVMPTVIVIVGPCQLTPLQ